MAAAISQDKLNVGLLQAFEKIIHEAKFDKEVDYFDLVYDGSDGMLYIIAVVIDARHGPLHSVLCFGKMRAFVTRAGIQIHPEPDPNLHIPPYDSSAVGLDPEVHATHH